MGWVNNPIWASRHDPGPCQGLTLNQFPGPPTIQNRVDRIAWYQRILLGCWTSRHPIPTPFLMSMPFTTHKSAHVHAHAHRFVASSINGAARLPLHAGAWLSGSGLPVRASVV